MMMVTSSTTQSGNWSNNNARPIQFTSYLTSINVNIANVMGFNTTEKPGETLTSSTVYSIFSLPPIHLNIQM